MTVPERDRGRGRRGEVEIDRSDSCALDVAERGGITLEEVGRKLGVCRERVRQIEVGAVRKLAALAVIRESHG